MVTIMRHVAIYCRRSRDPGEQAVSVGVQERYGRRFAEDHWPDLPVKVYVDNDLTAADPNVVRPGYRALLDALRGGLIEAVVVREQSRLTRQTIEWEEFCVAAQLAGVLEVHTVTAGPISVAEGSRLPGRIMAVVDAEYAEQTKVKVRLAAQALAEEGRPNGPAGYGYRMTLDDRGRKAREPDPSTAPVVRRIVEEVAAGSSLGLVARGLTADRVPTPRGAGRWHRETLRTIVRAPRIVGLRVHRGKTYPARWPAIVDRALWERALQSLEAGSVTNLHGTPVPVRRKITHQRTYLLTSGLAVCGKCGADLIASRQGVRPEGTVPAYACPSPTRAKPGCGGVSILADRLEDHVAALAADWLPQGTDVLNRHLAASGDSALPLRHELAHIEERLAGLAEQMARGDLLQIEHAAARRVYADQHRAVTARLATIAPSVDVTAAELVKAWETGEVPDQRRVLAVALAEPVKVHGAFRDGRRLPLDERVRVRFRA